MKNLSTFVAGNCLLLMPINFYFQKLKRLNLSKNKRLPVLYERKLRPGGLTTEGINLRLLWLGIYLFLFKRYEIVGIFKVSLTLYTIRSQATGRHFPCSFSGGVVEPLWNPFSKQDVISPTFTSLWDKSCFSTCILYPFEIEVRLLTLTVTIQVYSVSIPSLELEIKTQLVLSLEL